MNQDDVFYRAMMARDARFDGKFFIGVKTTGIFCRPICPAKPKRENIIFYSSALEAHHAGFRPCLRCRPESAPSSALWLGKSAIVRRALKLISRTEFFDESEEEFAAHFGVSARHLRRLFEEEMGLTPKQIASQNRLGFARKLVTETQLPMTEIAEASGFKSLRRFNDAFRSYFKVTPSVMRKGKEKKDSTLTCLSLSYRPPLNWEHLLRFFETHRIPELESVEKNSFSRRYVIAGEAGEFSLSPGEKDGELILQIETESPVHLFEVARRVRRMFDLDSDPLLIKEAFRKTPLLKRLEKKYPGLRVPGSWDPFEAGVCAVLGQLVSVKQARTLVGELVTHYGLERNGKRYFPTPEVLASSDLLNVRTTTRRRETIRKLSRQYLSGEIDLSGTLDLEEVKRRLLSLPGVGAWTAEYIGLRALGDTDAFPGTDLVLKRALNHHPDFSPESIRPWRAYGAMYLWKEYA